MSTTSCGSFAVNCVKSPVRPGVWLPCADQLLRRRLEVLDRAAALVEQLVGEAAELTEPLNRRRQERNDDRAGDLAERAEQLTDERLRRVLLARPLLEVLQLPKRMPWFGAEPAKLKPPTANIGLCSGIFATICSICFTMFIV